MARSENVYVVQENSSGLDPDMLIAAFTVKHELCTWLYRRYDRNIYVTRVQDGPTGGDASRLTNMPVDDLIRQGYEQDLARWRRTLPEYRGKEPEAPAF